MEISCLCNATDARNNKVLEFKSSSTNSMSQFGLMKCVESCIYLQWNFKCSLTAIHQVNGVVWSKVALYPYESKQSGRDSRLRNHESVSGKAVDYKETTALEGGQTMNISREMTVKRFQSLVWHYNGSQA